jgi:hypothetical protein
MLVRTYYTVKVPTVPYLFMSCFRDNDMIDFHLSLQKPTLLQVRT